jgi:hypothetical protein
MRRGKPFGVLLLNPKPHWFPDLQEQRAFEQFGETGRSGAYIVHHAVGATGRQSTSQVDGFACVQLTQKLGRPSANSVVSCNTPDKE